MPGHVRTRARDPPIPASRREGREGKGTKRKSPDTVAAMVSASSAGRRRRWESVRARGFACLTVCCAAAGRIVTRGYGNFFCCPHDQFITTAHGGAARRAVHPTKTWRGFERDDDDYVPVSFPDYLSRAPAVGVPTPAAGQPRRAFFNGTRREVSFNITRTNNLRITSRLHTQSDRFRCVYITLRKDRVTRARQY